MTTLLGKAKECIRKPVIWGSAYIFWVLALVVLVLGIWWYGVEVLRALSGILLALTELIHQRPQLNRVVAWIASAVAVIVILMLLVKAVSFFSRKAVSFFSRKYKLFERWFPRIIGGLFLVLLLSYLGYTIWACTKFGLLKGLFYPFRHLKHVRAFVDPIDAGWDWIYPSFCWLINAVHTLQLPLGDLPAELAPNLYQRSALGVVVFMVAWMFWAKGRRLVRDGKDVTKGSGSMVLIASVAVGLFVLASMDLYPLLTIGACLLLGLAARKLVGQFGSPGRFVLWGLLPIFVFALVFEAQSWSMIQSTIFAARDLGQLHSAGAAWLGLVFAYSAWALLGAILLLGYFYYYPMTVQAFLFWLVIFKAEPWLAKLALT